jgi:CheY-like chemotaxis protein
VPRPLRILIVDDSVTALTMAAAIVRSVGHEVDTAGDGAAALTRVTTLPFHLLLLDLELPDTTGFELAQRIRAIEGPNRFTPMFALSGTESATAKHECLSAGMLGLIKKPLARADVERFSRLARAP